MTALALLMKRTLALAALLGAHALQAAEPLIAVAAEGPEAQAAVSGVAARAPRILLFDARGTLLAAHVNPAAGKSGGAGPALARWLAERQVTLLIAGDVGAKLAPELQRLKIRRVKASGPAEQAVKAVTK